MQSRKTVHIPRRTLHRPAQPRSPWKSHHTNRPIPPHILLRLAKPNPTTPHQQQLRPGFLSLPIVSVLHRLCAISRSEKGTCARLRSSIRRSHQILCFYQITSRIWQVRLGGGDVFNTQYKIIAIHSRFWWGFSKIGARKLLQIQSRQSHVWVQCRGDVGDVEFLWI